jgi:hypothetical protein
MKRETEEPLLIDWVLRWEDIIDVVMVYVMSFPGTPQELLRHRRNLCWLAEYLDKEM